MFPFVQILHRQTMSERIPHSKLAQLVSRCTLVLCFSTALSSWVHALEFKPDWPEDHVSIGAGMGMNSMIYIGIDPVTYPVPMVDARWGALFIEGSRAGYEFLRVERVSVSLAGMWDRTELNIDDVNSANKNLYLGIEDRKPTAQVGLIGYYHSPVGLVEASYFHDVTATHDSSWTNLKISRPFPETGNWFINPGFFVKTYAEKYNRYYYSVTQEQNILGAKLQPEYIDSTDGEENVTPELLARFEREFRPRYKPGNSGHIGVDLEVDYHFTPNLSIQSYWSIEKLTGEIETSPLVEDMEIYLAEIGLVFSF
jgi:outer membrane scaffolding protein for murein synthesis (MipA/OmpV family)